MNTVYLRQWLYFTLLALRGQPLGATYRRFLKEDQSRRCEDIRRDLLVRMLAHCHECVPYYAQIMDRAGDGYDRAPEEYLQRFPILTKDIIRDHFEALKSSDLQRRRWYFNTSGGSTGDPVRFIQDWEYTVRSGAITLLFSRLAGHEVGEPEVWLWGSVRDLVDGSMGWRATIVNGITRTIFLNALHMSPDRMRRYVATLNATKPKLIIAYAESAFELATFAENQGIRVEPQEAMITSAGTLYPFMRSTIERVFQCRVFNRYGSREVGDIGFERPGCEGLWVAPWGSYIEIVDEAGRRLPPGREGEILVTSLTNYAMPLMRYRIGDRGALMPGESEPAAGRGQVLQSVIGRTCDTFRDRDGNLVHPGYFVFLLYFRDWVGKFQVIQKSLSCIVFKIVKSGPAPDRVELEEIARKTRFVMGEDCEVLFEFVDDIPVAESGKRRFTISDVAVAERQP